MRTVISVLILVFSSQSFAAPKKIDTDKAKAAVVRWLTLIDEGLYAKGYEAASEVLRDKQPEDKWTDQIKKARLPFGKFLKRHLRMKQLDSDNFLIFQFVGSFENKADTTETVTPHLDKDGRWRVADYLIK